MLVAHFSVLKNRADRKSESEQSAMQLKSYDGKPGLGHSAAPTDQAVEPGDLEKLGRWVPRKEVELLIEICERAQRDPDLMRAALLLCSAYAERVARMLDQDPIPSVTRKIADRLSRLRIESGL